MAKSDHTGILERLRKAHTAAAQKASESLEDTIQAANNAADGDETETRKLFRKQEARTRKAVERWRDSADKLRKHLRKKKA